MIILRKFILILLLLFLPIFLNIADAQRVGVVTGIVLCRDGSKPKGCPGLTISLVKPGKGGKTITDSAGRFTFDNVPLSSDPYYLEIYWGKRLKFRKKYIINSDLTKLPPITLW
jgi:hypothetical protein